MQSTKTDSSEDIEDPPVNLCLSSDGYCACADLVLQSNAAYLSGSPPPAPVEPECATRVSVPSSVVSTMLSAGSLRQPGTSLSMASASREASPDDLPQRKGIIPQPFLTIAPSREELEMHYRYAVEYFFHLGQEPESCSVTSEAPHDNIEDTHGITPSLIEIEDMFLNGSAGQAWARTNAANAKIESAHIQKRSYEFTETFKVEDDTWAALFMGRRAKARIRILKHSVSAVTGRSVSMWFQVQSRSFVIECDESSTIDEAKHQLSLLKPHHISVPEDVWQALMSNRKDGILTIMEDKVKCHIHVDRLQHEVRVNGSEEGVQRCKELFAKLNEFSTPAAMIEAIAQSS